MAIDMITYEFLKNYVEGSVMGENATPRGTWTKNPTSPYAKGHYVTHNNTVYIWYNEQTSTTKGNPKPGVDNGWEECWQEIIKTVGYYDKDRLENHTYYTPSTGLEIEDGVVVGIGSCRDEHIVIPELYDDGGVKKPVYRIAFDVFGSSLGDKGVQIKSITFPYSIKELSPCTIDSQHCPNLESVYLMNPGVSWDKNDSCPFYFEANVKDIYFGFSKAQYYKMIERNGGTLIALRNENIAAGIVPTKHFGYFVSRAEVDEKLKNPSYEEQVKLKGITTAVPDWEDASAYITDNSIGSASADFIIDIQGDVKFNSSCVGEPEHTADFYIDGEMVAQCHDGASFDFDGHVSQNIRVHCSFMDVYFIEFTKKVYVKDAVGDINDKIGNIDAALDSILAIQESIIGGAEQ